MSFEERVYEVVRRIPAGQVASYGDVAALAGRPRHARHVGRALSRLPEDTTVPWWRVVRAGGGIALPAFDHADRLQRALLASEGVTLTDAGRVRRRHFLGEEAEEAPVGTRRGRGRSAARKPRR